MRDDFYDGLPDDEEPVDLSVERAGALAGRVVEPGEHVEPADIEHTRVCAFKAKPCKTCGRPRGAKVHTPKKTATCEYKRQNGCALCGRPKNAPEHLGAPESFNVFASGSWEAYQAAKQRWHKVLAPALKASGLPKGLHRIVVEGEVSFGDATKRDQGNHRVVLEKALGDVLVEEGYLVPDDSWEHYEFGGLSRVDMPGVNRIRLMLFPQAPPLEPPAPAAGVQGSLL